MHSPIQQLNSEIYYLLSVTTWLTDSNETPIVYFPFS